MAITSNAEAEVWDILNLQYGSKWPPYAFEVVDENDDPITGFTVKTQIRTYAGSAVVKKELTDTDGYVKVGNLVTFDDTKAVDFGPGAFVYDTEILLTGDTIPTTQYKGSMIVNRDVTRPTPP